MKYLHTMIRVKDLDKSLEFFIDKLGMLEVSRKEVPQGKYTLVFIAANKDEPPLELTYNWEQTESYSTGDNFGHIAYGVENIYKFCEKLQTAGITILRPPRDGKMAFIRSPDEISVELLQIGEPMPIQEPWASMKSQGKW